MTHDIAARIRNRGSAGMGRPKGALNKATSEIKSIAQEHGAACVQRLAELAGVVKGPDGEPIGRAQSEKAQIAAIALLLDRAYGKPATVLANDDESPLLPAREVRIYTVDAPPPETREEWIARQQRQAAQRVASGASTSAACNSCLS